MKDTKREHNLALENSLENGLFDGEYWIVYKQTSDDDDPRKYVARKYDEGVVTQEMIIAKDLRSLNQYFYHEGLKQVASDWWPGNIVCIWR